MTTTQKKKEIKRLVKDMLKESYKKAELNVDKALNASVLDIESWDKNNAPMILPKIILTAILENESTQYTGRGTSHEKRVKKEVKNLKYFI